MKPPPDSSAELATLAALGFAPDAALMNDSRLFLDERLLCELIAELQDELEGAQAAATLFRVGLIHGLRDADRVVAHGFLPPGAGGLTRADDESARIGWPSLLLEIAPLHGGGGFDAGIALGGRWPQAHEAAAWLRALGPAEDPACWLSCGYTSGWLSGTLGADVVVLEYDCAACGAAECGFVAHEADAWEFLDPGRVADAIGRVDFDLFRAAALRAPAGPVPELVESQGDFDREAPLVHIWGPVMVLPFTSEDEILRTTEALSRDPGTPAIRAVVVDLRDRTLDEGFGAAAIERVLDTIQTWGAEPVLTGVAPFSEPVVAGLESHHLVVRKDLGDAIAAAFLIAEAQRHAA